MPPSCSALDATCLFQFNERLGILMNVLSSTFSTAASGGLLVYITVRRRKSFGLRRSEDDLDGNGLILLISLLVADLIQAIGGMQSARWLLDARLTEGPLCTFQSVFLNIGEVAIALSALSIALHTFCVLVLGWRFTRLTLRTIAAGIWCLTALIIGISNRGRKHYYGDTGYWCWITEDYLPERITASYLWMWITFFSLIILYFFMFLVMRGIVTMKRDRDENRTTGQGDEEESLSKRVAYLMLFYPAVYLVCIAPISVSRWIDGDHPTHSSPGAVLGGHTLFTLSGVFNAILFSFTRPTLVKGDAETRDDSEDTEMQQQQHLSEDTRKMEQALPAHRHVSMENNRALGTIASWDSAESPVLEPNPLPRLQATLSITREAQSGPHGHGRLPD